MSSISAKKIQDMPEWVQSTPAVIRKDRKLAYMGWVTTDKGSRHKVRVACEHWAPHPEATDCRNGCEDTKQKRQAANA